MNRYETSIPRAAFGIAAAALTAITFGLSVVVPANMNSGAQDAPRLATALAAEPTPSAAIVASTAVINPPCIEVTAVRDPSLASVPVRGAAKRKQQG